MPRPTRLSAEPLEDRTVPATLTVTTLADAGPGSLRQVVADANATPDTSDDIVFAAAVRGGTVGLTAADPATTAGTNAERLAGPSALVVRSPITILGTGETITRTGATVYRLFQVTAAGNLTLRNLTLSNGLAQGFDARPGGGGVGRPRRGRVQPGRSGGRREHPDRQPGGRRRRGSRRRGIHGRCRPRR